VAGLCPAQTALDKLKILGPVFCIWDCASLISDRLISKFENKPLYVFSDLIGLSQLLIFPFVPRLMKAFDLRLIVFVGTLIFGGSCLLNIHMNPDFGGPQFQIGNVIRASGGNRSPSCLCPRLLPLGY
jgi:hypothetical protein